MRRKKRGEEHGHHGGGWKIAYADFITTMMAFFLLLWLLSSTTADQRKGISDYFHGVVNLTDAPKFMDQQHENLRTPDQVTQTDENPYESEDQPTPNQGEQLSSSMQGGNTFTGNVTSQTNKHHEAELFKATEEAIIKAVQESAEIRAFADQLIMEQTDEGLKIQIIDHENRPLFTSGSANMLDHTKKIITLVAQVIKKVPNNISISGHTDATPFSKGNNYSNWELSADRANASRRVFLSSGFPAARISSVVGKESNELLTPNDPYSAKNRRVCVTLLKDGTK
jgi:chemotaxis protein MotB